VNLAFVGLVVVASQRTEAIDVYDHDWASLAEGIAIPHGIYDVAKNKGFLQIGTSRDTSEFACDCLYYCWCKQGSKDYPNANSLYKLVDQLKEKLASEP